MENEPNGAMEPNELNSEALVGTKSAWTPERRARQAEVIRQTKPWERSTGPRSPEGKAISSQNARVPDVFREAKEKREAVMKAAFEIFGLKRSRRLRRPRK